MKVTTDSPKMSIYSPRFKIYIKIALVVMLVIVLSFIWFLNSKLSIQNKIENPTFEQNQKQLPYHIKKFSNDVVKYEDFRRRCYHNTDPKSIEDLSAFVLMLRNRRHLICSHHHELFTYIYHVRVKYTTIKISASFLIKVKRWLHDNKELIEASKNQSLIFVDNLYTQESVVFNPVRSNRPGVGGAADVLKYINDLVDKTSKSCDFCSYTNNTANDLFGRMESKHAVIVSNTFKIEKYHGMALLRSHNPLQFSQEQFIDLVNLALKWFHRVHKLTPGHLYRIMYWDILPKASASQVHPHVHLTLGDFSYYAKWNHLYKSGLEFSKQHATLNYWTSLLQIHTSLGLTVKFGKASLMAYLTPQKDFEVLIISEKPCLDFFRLAFFAIRAFIDNLEQHSMSMGFVFPKLNADTENGDELPMLLRIVSRGAADSTRSDISSFDLFGTPNVNRDPFKLITKIRESVERQKMAEFNYSSWKD